MNEEPTLSDPPAADMDVPDMFSTPMEARLSFGQKSENEVDVNDLETNFVPPVRIGVSTLPLIDNGWGRPMPYPVDGE
jgi:hypothetical protein